MRYVVIRDYTGPEGRDNRARAGDVIECSDERGKDLIRWGLVLPEDAVPKALTAAGPARRSPSSLPGRRSRTSTVAKPESVIESSRLTTIGDECVLTSSTPATESGGTDTTETFPSLGWQTPNCGRRTP